MFLSHAHEVGAGDIVITMSGRAAVRLCVCAALFRFRSDSPDDIFRKPLAGLFFHIAYTHPLWGVDVPFGGFDL